MVDTHSYKLSPFGPALQFVGGSNEISANSFWIRRALFDSALFFVDASDDISTESRASRRAERADADARSARSTVRAVAPRDATSEETSASVRRGRERRAWRAHRVSSARVRRARAGFKKTNPSARPIFWPSTNRGASTRSVNTTRVYKRESRPVIESLVLRRATTVDSTFSTATRSSRARVTARPSRALVDRSDRARARDEWCRSRANRARGRGRRGGAADASDARRRDDVARGELEGTRADAGGDGTAGDARCVQGIRTGDDVERGERVEWVERGGDGADDARGEETHGGGRGPEHLNGWTPRYQHR